MTWCAATSPPSGPNRAVAHRHHRAPAPPRASSTCARSRTSAPTGSSATRSTARMKASLAVAACATRWPCGGTAPAPSSTRTGAANFDPRSSSARCATAGLHGSMGRVGTCADNAAMESFFALLQKNWVSGWSCIWSSTCFRVPVRSQERLVRCAYLLAPAAVGLGLGLAVGETGPVFAGSCISLVLSRRHRRHSQPVRNSARRRSGLSHFEGACTTSVQRGNGTQRHSTDLLMFDLEAESL